MASSRRGSQALPDDLVFRGHVAVREWSLVLPVEFAELGLDADGLEDRRLGLVAVGDDHVQVGRLAIGLGAGPADRALGLEGETLDVVVDQVRAEGGDDRPEVVVEPPVGEDVDDQGGAGVGRIDALVRVPGPIPREFSQHLVRRGQEEVVAQLST